MLWRLLCAGTVGALALKINRYRPTVAGALGCAIALIPLYAAQLALVALQSQFQDAGRFAWMAALPIPVSDDRAGNSWTHAPYACAALAIGLAQCVALGVVVLSLRQRPAPLDPRILAAIACAMATLSLIAPAMATTDPYEFAATGLLGFRSYAPSHDAFVGTLYEAFANHIPMQPVVYGPLWVAIDIAQTHFGSSIYGKIEALRITNVAFVAGFVWLLSKARVPRTGLVACALCPALWLYAVADPHADIQGLVLFAAAYAFARRSKALPAAIFIVLAGLIKFPFVVLGGALLAPLPGAARRCCIWIAAIAAVLVASYAIEGGAYAADVSHVAVRHAHANWSPDWLVFAPLSALFTAVLLVSRRGFTAVPWFFHQLAPLAEQWYLFWGIPYALSSERFVPYVVLMPLAAPLVQLRGLPAQIVIVSVTSAIAFDFFVGRVHWIKRAFVQA